MSKADEKVIDGYSCLGNYARWLGLPDYEPIPSGVVAAVEKLTLQPSDANKRELLHEFVDLCFQCARYERTSTDWIAAGDILLTRITTPDAKDAGWWDLTTDECRLIYEDWHRAEEHPKGLFIRFKSAAMKQKESK